jgi:hypothetical protein
MYISKDEKRKMINDFICEYFRDCGLYEVGDCDNPRYYNGVERTCSLRDVLVYEKIEAIDKPLAEKDNRERI